MAQVAVDDNVTPLLPASQNGRTQIFFNNMGSEDVYIKNNGDASAVDPFNGFVLRAGGDLVLTKNIVGNKINNPWTAMSSATGTTINVDEI